MGINQFVGRIPKASPEGVTLPRFCLSSDTVLSPILSNLLVSVVLCTVEMPPCGGLLSAYICTLHIRRLNIPLGIGPGPDGLPRTPSARSSENAPSTHSGEYGSERARVRSS